MAIMGAVRAGADPLGDVGAVIVAYRSADVIADAIGGLPPDRLAAIVVVDNASPDASADVVLALGRREVEVVRAPTNLGFGGGNNLGVASLPSSVSRVLFLNPDARIDEHSLKQLLAWLDDHPSCALVGPRVRDGAGTPVTSAGRDASLLTEVRPLLPRALGRALPARRFDAAYDVAGPVGYVEGGCMLVDRARFEAAGRFDERFFLYFEELDLATRLRGQGWTVDLCPDAWVEHRMAASTSAEPFGARTHIWESSIRYLRKWRRPGVATAFAMAARASWALRTWTGKLDPEARAAYRRALQDGRRQ